MVCDANLHGMGFYSNVSLYELFLSSFLLTNSHLPRNRIVLWSIQRFLLVETRFHVETGQLVIDKECRSIAWFQYSVPYSIKSFLKNLSESFINNLCAKICNSFNTLKFFHIPLNIVSGILRIKLQFMIICLF